MTAQNHHAAPAGSTAGLILSLSACLPPSNPLARRARRLADRLEHHPSRPLQDRASELLARLLDATDTGLAYAEEGCLDTEFDE